MSDFWIGVAETALGLFSVAALVSVWEWHRTTKRLKKYVTQYIDSAEFEWENQTEKFALMHRVRAFEILLRNIEGLQPRTPGAYYRVEQVRDVLEHFHRSIPIWRGQHLPLPKIGEFPLPQPNYAMEASVRHDTLEKLKKIQWLRLKEPAEQ